MHFVYNIFNALVVLIFLLSVGFSVQQRDRSRHQERKHCQRTGHYFYASCCPKEINKTITSDGLDILSGGIPGAAHCNCQLGIPTDSYVDLLTFRTIDGRHNLSCELRLHHADFVLRHNVTSSFNKCRRVVHMDHVVHMFIYYNKVTVTWDQGEHVDITRIARILGSGKNIKFQCGSHLSTTTKTNLPTTTDKNIIPPKQHHTSNNGGNRDGKIIPVFRTNPYQEQSEPEVINDKNSTQITEHKTRSGRRIVLYAAIASSVLISCLIVVAIAYVVYSRLKTSADFDSCSATYASLSGKHVADDIGSLSSFESANTKSLLLSSPDLIKDWNNRSPIFKCKCKDCVNRELNM